MKINKSILIILDGWGIAKDPKVSAVDLADTPYFDYLIKNYPHSRLKASEEAVGLPAGQMGNSEVGHMNIGAGRIVFQDLERINRSFKQDTPQSNECFERNPVWMNLLDYCKENSKPLHLIGLLSEGGVHSHLRHLYEILNLLVAMQGNRPNVYLHLFTDGRDVAPDSALKILVDLEEYCRKHSFIKIASLIGRYYAMDRNQNFDKIAKAYFLLTRGKGEIFKSCKDAIMQSYNNAISDEFILPCVITEDQPITIQDGDAVFCFNFRTDRCRQITRALTQEEFPALGMKPLKLKYVTMTRYDETFKDIGVIFEKSILSQTLGQIISENNKTQIRIAETEKYPHVTFFFNGGSEIQLPGEKRILCPSPAVVTYDLMPEMSAAMIADKICQSIDEEEPDFICLNFANPDMVGHSGILDAAIKACETVDEKLKQVVTKALEKNYQILIIADHGNADCMIKDDGSPHTAHTLAEVPCIWVGNNQSIHASLKNGILADIAPTILNLMNIQIPEIMTGTNLISFNLKK